MGAKKRVIMASSNAVGNAREFISPSDLTFSWGGCHRCLWLNYKLLVEFADNVSGKWQSSTKRIKIGPNRREEMSSNGII